MKYAFHDQLIPEVRHAGCDPDGLLAQSGKGGKAGFGLAASSAPSSAPAPTTIPPQALPKKATPDPPPRTATMITFHVDNSHCNTAVRVYVDGVDSGAVQAQSRGGFRTRTAA